MLLGGLEVFAEEFLGEAEEGLVLLDWNCQFRGEKAVWAVFTRRRWLS